eukprot:8763428-Ditylum_brightwellii.AAC.1
MHGRSVGSMQLTHSIASDYNIELSAQLSHNSMIQDGALSDVHFFNENNIYHLPQHSYEVHEECLLSPSYNKTSHEEMTFIYQHDKIMRSVHKSWFSNPFRR